MKKGSHGLRREGRRFIALVLCLATWLLFQAIPAYGKTGGNLLQFSSKGHILGFSPGSMYLASGDHLVKVDFVEGRSVTSVTHGGQVAGGTIQPLSRVNYPNIWDGVSAVYEGSSRSVVKSSYTVTRAAVRRASAYATIGP